MDGRRKTDRKNVDVSPRLVFQQPPVDAIHRTGPDRSHHHHQRSSDRPTSPRPNRHGPHLDEKRECFLRDKARRISIPPLSFPRLSRSVGRPLEFQSGARSKWFGGATGRAVRRASVRSSQRRANVRTQAVNFRLISRPIFFSPRPPGRPPLSSIIISAKTLAITKLK